MFFTTEPIAYAVFWGLPDCPFLHWPPYKTEAEALAKAITIKSNTKVLPLYTDRYEMIQNENPSTI